MLRVSRLARSPVLLFVALEFRSPFFGFRFWDAAWRPAWIASCHAKQMAGGERRSTPCHLGLPARLCLLWAALCMGLLNGIHSSNVVRSSAVRCLFFTAVAEKQTLLVQVTGLLLL